jgi:tetratricopeptide (TPR) repeat protein
LNAQRFPPDPEADALHAQGLALQRSGHYEQSAEQFRQEVRLRPGSARAHGSLAEVLRLLGRAEESLEHFRRAAELAPTAPFAQANFGQILLHLGRPAEAIAPCQEAVRLQPLNPLLRLILGDALRLSVRLQEARAVYLEALRLQPRLAPAHANLGLLLLAQNKVHEALAPLGRATALEPNNASFWEHLARAHAAANDFWEAIRCWQRALTLQPGEPRLHLRLAEALETAGRFAEAEQHIRIALRVQPNSAEALVGLGSLCEQCGNMAEAEAAFRAALERQPGHSMARVRLVRLRRGEVSEADRRALEERLADPLLQEQERGELLFALAAVHDAGGSYNQAADCARRANGLCLERARRLDGGYDPQRYRSYIDRVVQAFDRDFVRHTAGGGLPTRRPVFIFGLPRSGTTLVEQVLASHRSVHGAGEVHLGWQSLMAIPDILGRKEDPLACVPALDAAAVRRLAEKHLRQLDALDVGGRERIVDKLPDNYERLGLLAAMFPQAVFLHCRRDLRDVAVSCWMTNFRGLAWTHDLGHIEARFGEYVRLMSHWREVLPVTLHEVVYEEVVGDLEGAARRLVAACGLEWDPACLDFHRTRRPVVTASAVQVRTPLYRQSVGRWQHYAIELGDLEARLNELTRQMG